MVLDKTDKVVGASPHLALNLISRLIKYPYIISSYPCYETIAWYFRFFHPTEMSDYSCKFFEFFKVWDKADLDAFIKLFRHETQRSILEKSRIYYNETNKTIKEVTVSYKQNPNCEYNWEVTANGVILHSGYSSNLDWAERDSQNSIEEDFRMVDDVKINRNPPSYYFINVVSRIGK